MTFRNVKKTPAISNHIEAQLKKLKRFGDNIIRCHVVLELPHKRRTSGNDYRVRVDAMIPKAVVVGRSNDKHVSRDDLHSAITDAFSSVERQLASRKSRRGGYDLKAA